MSAARERFRQLVLWKNQDAVDDLGITLIMSGAARSDELETWLREDVEAAPHDVQQYWCGECNCDGHQN